jgi:N-acetylmuramoyl-L-alanine amidase
VNITDNDEHFFIFARIFPNANIIALIPENHIKVVLQMGFHMVNSIRFTCQALYEFVEIGYYYHNMTIQQHPPSWRPSGVHIFRILQTVFSVAILLATLFVAFSPKMFSGNLNSLVSNLLVQNQTSNVAVPTAQSAVRIGIVSGHWSNGEDAGAVCPDGTNEHDVNLAIASLVRQKLEARGFSIDLLQEYDPRLDGYRAAVLISIHADTCNEIDDQATGFKVTASTYSRDQRLADRLTACMDDRYAGVTTLRLHPGSVTVDMTDYHAFSVIDSATTAAIIETGFLNLDREILVQHPDVISDGVVSGILCFVNNESVKATPVPSP